MSQQGKMIAFAAPSGAGKSTIVRHLLDKFNDLEFSVSATTREPRPGEENGVQYYFLSADEFKDRIDKDEFVEWEQVYQGLYYGTLKSEVKRLWDEGKYIIFDIDVKGAMNLKKQYGEKCLTVFVKPPSVDALLERLKNRMTESEESLEKRRNRFKEELAHENSFDKVLVNDILEYALKDAEQIVEVFIPEIT